MKQHLAAVDGVMIGRQAYQHPYMFATVDQDFYQHESDPLTRHQVLRQFLPYALEQVQLGTSIPTLIKPLLGLFQGMPRARLWRRSLSDAKAQRRYGLDVVNLALSHIGHM